MTVKVYIFYSKKNVCQIKIEIKREIKVKIICNSKESLFRELCNLARVKFSEKFVICNQNKLARNDEIMKHLESFSVPLNFEKMAEYLSPKINFAQNKPSDIIAHIQQISPITISRADAERILAFL